MSEILKKNQVVKTEISKLDCRVGEFLGGGQGEVYKADLGGQAVALKWYYPNSATPQQRTALEKLIEKGAPNARFLWPAEIVTESSTPGFGYVMPLREKRFGNIVDLMKRRISPKLAVLVRVGFELANSFLQLHSKGLCYRDISFGNAFFDPNTGEVLICDNDNVSIDGQSDGGVLGTPRFMAPEVVRGDSKPNKDTDLYSLAVLLFYILMTSHPLEGKKESDIKCFDLPAMNKLYGTEPVFIYDPADDSNRPVKGYHDNAIAFWDIYPEFIKNLFMKAFTTGIKDPVNGRVRESEWRMALIRLLDSVMYCKCGAENFYDKEKLQKNKSLTCWDCRKAMTLPPRINIGGNIVMLNYDTKIHPHHIDDHSKIFDFSILVAEVNQNPNKPGQWGLKNDSSEKWNITMPDGTLKDVEPGRNAPILNGLKINFGKATGEIRA